MSTEWRITGIMNKLGKISMSMVTLNKKFAKEKLLEQIFPTMSWKPY